MARAGGRDGEAARERRVRINVDDEADRWRWVCPAGHREWEPTNEHFWCANCARTQGLDGSFERLLDLSTDETYYRDEIVLDTEAGEYRDVYGEEGAP